jgi:hypothetical protein
MLPEAFLTRMKAQLGEEYEDFLKNVRLEVVGGCDVRLP